jgi:Periplasmic binding protein
VRYLVKLRRIPVRQIAVFAQQDIYGDSGFAGVAKAVRALGVSDTAIVRLNYKRNTVDVDDAINQLKLQKPPIKAIVMVATYRAAAKFIEKTHDLFPGMIYTNVSFVGSTALADELMLLGPRYASGVIVTQVVPAVSGYSSVVLEYKNALAKYFAGEAPDYVARGLRCGQRSDQGATTCRTATRYREADRRPGELAHFRPGSWRQSRFWPRRTPSFAQDLGNGDRRKRKIPGDRTRIAG